MSIALRTLAGIAVFGVAVGVAVVVSRPASDVPQPKLSDVSRVLEHARLSIAAESRGGVREAVVQAPPDRRAGSAEPVAAAPVPTAPEGYSFTAAPTKLELAAYQPTSTRGADGESTEDDALSWLSGHAPVTSIVRMAKRMQRDWVFGWLRLADGATVQDVHDEAVRLGVDILGASGRLLRVRLPASESSLVAATALPSVSGLGVMPPESKSHEAFRSQLHAEPLRRLPVLITLMGHDQDGRWQRALEARGVEVGRFDADIRAYAANVDAAAFEAALHADFVLAIEPMGVVRAAHDTAVPAMSVDAVRFHDDAPGLFRGTTGSAVPIGVMDTGLNINHLDISTHRSSICGANFIPIDSRVEDADLWVDENGHGTHVTGTVAGNGFAKSRHAGMAPGVTHIRFAKVLSRSGLGLWDGIHRGMDFLANASSCGSEGQAAKPLVVNMSLSADSRTWLGRTSSERKLDAVVWAHRQLYVVAQSNASISGFSNYSAAKNSLPVGAVYDNGELAGFSSWGPTHDGRLAPLLVATGMHVYSARGQGSRGGYNRFDGTSMASPTVAGVAALLLDAVADYREQPALTRARLMASAIKPDAWLDAGSAFPANNSAGPGMLQAQFGLGKASARTSVLQRRNSKGWQNGAAVSTMTAESYGFQDIVVPQGAERLDLVLAWDEPPADTIGSTVLNDLDLWLNKDADCDTAACGEYASTSRLDNVEWIIVKNPAAGRYQARVVPHRLYTAAPRAGLAWTIVRGASTPNLRLAVDGQRRMGDRKYRVALTLSVNAYVAAGVEVFAYGCRTEDDAECTPTVQVQPPEGEDGIVQSPPSPPSWNDDHAMVGEVGVGERQRIEFDIDLGTDQAARMYFTASARNANPAATSVAFASGDVLGGGPPGQAAPPENDHFADAVVLDGATGSVEADLLAATFEAGEPAAKRDGQSPAASMWYQWTAPAQGAVNFGTSGAHVDVFRGEHIAALTQLVAAEWNVSFFAKAGQTYLVRISCDTRNRCAPAQTLRWSQGQRPANDDFAAAVELLEAEGEVAGDNSGATLEPGELFGDLAATVWYRWTAPEDGPWTFRADQWQSRLLVFTGDDVATLRLAAGFQSNRAELRVQSGTEYRIVVAARDAFNAGRAFTLSWEQNDEPTSTDDIASATELQGATGSTQVSVGESVEPGEPVQTGVRTRWWVWTAPSSGRFVWRLTDTQNTAIKVAVFAHTDAEDAESAPSLTALRPLASTGPRVTDTDLVFDAVADRRYWISVGFHADDYAAFGYSESATLEWGETPANDSLAQAIALEGGSGSTTFSNRFGTLEPDERSGVLGGASLWWAFTPQQAGWYRFSLDGPIAATLAIYRVRGTGIDGLQLVARSHGDWQAPNAGDAIEAVFDATAEQRYLIRVGRRGELDATEATLTWDETDAPTWLRYAGRLNASALGLKDGSTYATPAMAFEERGAALYLAASDGIHILDRDAASGTLTPNGVVEVAEPQALVWDHSRSKLYVFNDCAWRQFAPDDDTRLTLVDEGALEISDGDVPSCDVRAAFLDSTGAFLHYGHVAGIDVYAVGETGLATVDSVAIESFAHAVASPAGAKVYATSGYSLQVYTRNQNTGALTLANAVDLDHWSATLAANHDDYVVALAENGTAYAYELGSDSGTLRQLNVLDPVGNPSWLETHGECGFIAARFGLDAFDGFCRNSAFSAAIRSADGSNRLEATDYVANWQADRFNNHIPEFKSQAFAASPDGRHAYVYSEGDILIFERIGSPPPVDREDAASP